ncbi:hypothetical protein BN1088_1110005 [Sphingobacterium sp. PM2-P1-29]|nr:hypothetical protein BN1088_1110005 [Sphingobacterium sp. PM2-P1-29]
MTTLDLVLNKLLYSKNTQKYAVVFAAAHARMILDLKVISMTYDRCLAV